MTINEKKELIAKIVTMLDQLIPADERSKKSDFSENSNPVEMLTIKECAESIKGLSEHTDRQLVAQKRIPFIRTGGSARENTYQQTGFAEFSQYSVIVQKKYFGIFPNLLLTLNHKSDIIRSYRSMS